MILLNLESWIIQSWISQAWIEREAKFQNRATMFDIVSINYGIFVALTARFTRRLIIDCSIIRVLRIATEPWITA